MAVQTNFIESDNGVEKAKDDLNVINFDDFKELDEEGKEVEDDFPYIGLCVPQDPIEDLEWYPNFDSGLLDLSLIDIDVNQMPLSQEKKYNETPMITTKKPRSKRVLSDVELSNEEKLDSALSPNANSWNIKKKQRSAIIYNTVDSWSDELLTSYDEKPRKKVGRPIVKRTCSHCGTNSTPQWREGPMGRNTLCNVCGVRYKSGRLVPEYRPLNCPDFDIQVHSNRHKKIVKKKKAKDKLDLEWLPYRK